MERKYKTSDTAVICSEEGVLVMEGFVGLHGGSDITLAPDGLD